MAHIIATVLPVSKRLALCWQRVGPDIAFLTGGRSSRPEVRLPGTTRPLLDDRPGGPGFGVKAP
jgi:hypothetical protein